MFVYPRPGEAVVRDGAYVWITKPLLWKQPEPLPPAPIRGKYTLNG